MAGLQRIPEPVDADAIDHFVYLRDVSFQEYEAVLEMRGEASVPRMTYLEGVLELMRPSRHHRAGGDNGPITHLPPTLNLSTRVNIGATQRHQMGGSRIMNVSAGCAIS